MIASGCRVLVVAVALAAHIFPLASAAQGAPDIDTLIPQVQGKDASQVRALIVRQFGPPARDVGSGLQIEQWDVDGGVLTFHPLQGPTFQKQGVRTRLIRTHNPASLCLFGSYEMVTAPQGEHGMKYWLGDVSLSGDGYNYTDSDANLDHRERQRNNFFLLHPKGLVQVKYASGVTPETLLENLPDDSVVATVTLATPDRQVSKTYRIRTNRTSMSLAFEGDEMQFQMAKGWVHYWR
jgi:hypothetical protein